MVEASGRSAPRHRYLAIVLLFGTFLLIYAPAFRVNGVVVKLYQVPMVILASLWLVQHLWRGSIRKQLLVFSITFLLALGYASVVVAANGWYDAEIVEYLLYGFLLAIAADAWVGIYRRVSGDYQYYVLRDIFLAGVMHASVMLLLFFAEGASDFVYKFIVLTEKGAEFVETGTRSPGLTTGGGAALSVAQSAALMCGLFAIETRAGSLCKVRTMTNYFIGGLLIVLSMMVSGRSGIVAILVFFMVIAGFAVLGQKVARKVLRNMCLLLLAMSVTGFVALSLFVPDSFSYTTRWIFEAYFNYVETGQLYMKSVASIANNMYFIPSTDISTILGTSNLGRSDVLAYIPSDVGYVRLIFAVGVVGTMLVMAPYVYIGVLGSKRAVRRTGVLLVGLTVVQFVMNFKELFFVLVQGWTFIYYMVAWSVTGRARGEGHRFSGSVT